MIAERVQVCRTLAYRVGSALARRPTTMPNPTRLTLMKNQNDDRDRPTDPVQVMPESVANLPAIAPPGRVPESWTDLQLQTFLTLAQEIKAAQEAQNLDTLLDRQTDRITKRLDESDRRSDVNYSLVSEQVRGLVHAIDAIGIRVGQIETKQETLTTSQESSADLLERLQLDMAAMRHQVDRMDAELIVLRHNLNK